jgi:hypothetical protein
MSQENVEVEKVALTRSSPVLGLIGSWRDIGRLQGLVHPE